MSTKKKTQSQQFNPPRDGIVFVKMWNIILPELRARANFNPAYHLRLLEILCNLFQEEETLTDILDICGFTYPTSGRNGDLVKQRPEVAQLNRSRQQIKQYSQLLNFGISKNKNHASAGDTGPDAKTSEWD